MAIESPLALGGEEAEIEGRQLIKAWATSLVVRPIIGTHERALSGGSPGMIGQGWARIDPGFITLSHRPGALSSTIRGEPHRVLLHQPLAAEPVDPLRDRLGLGVLVVRIHQPAAAE